MHRVRSATARRMSIPYYVVSASHATCPPRTGRRLAVPDKHLFAQYARVTVADIIEGYPRTDIIEPSPAVNISDRYGSVRIRRRPMTHRERVLAALNRQPLDRFPVDLWYTP